MSKFDNVAYQVSDYVLKAEKLDRERRARNLSNTSAIVTVVMIGLITVHCLVQ